MNLKETKTIKVKTEKRPYDVVIGRDIFRNVIESTVKEYKDSNIAIITDSNIEKIYGDKIYQVLDKKTNTFVISFKAGEESKNRKTKKLKTDYLNLTLAGIH